MKVELELIGGGTAGLAKVPDGTVLTIMSINAKAKPWNINGDLTHKIEVKDAKGVVRGISHSSLLRSKTAGGSTIKDISDRQAGKIYIPDGQLTQPLVATVQSVKSSDGKFDNKFVEFAIDDTFFATV